MKDYKEKTIKEMEENIAEMEKNMDKTKEQNFLLLNNLKDENDQMQKTIEVTNELVKKLENKIINKDSLI